MAELISTKLHAEQHLLLVCPTTLPSMYPSTDALFRINRCYECPSS